MILLRCLAQRAKIGKMVFVEADEFANREHVVAEFNVVNLATVLLSHGLAVNLPINLLEFSIGPGIS